MADLQPTPPPSPAQASAAAPQGRAPIPIAPAELWWLTFAVWLGGIFILALMPVILIPRVGMGAGVAGSYLLFFIAWQPIQQITQRAMGVRSAVVRMIIFVGTAATIAFYVREALLGLLRS